MKKLIIFDLDGTLAVSKSALDDEMSKLLKDLADRYIVAIISGGHFPQFEKQFISNLHPNINLRNIHLYPTSGSAYFKFNVSGWEKIYGQELSSQQKEAIYSVLSDAQSQWVLPDVSEIYGQQIEDRGSQISWSALGQECPIELKETWDPDHAKRKKILTYISPLLPDLECRSGGTTTIDITEKGIDKRYGIRKMHKDLHIAYEDMYYVGDAIFPGGNDYAAVQMGLDHFQTEGPEQTKEEIKKLLT